MPSALPSTRLLRPRRKASGWWLGVALALLTNTAVIAILVKVSHVAVELTPAPPLAQKIKTVEPPEEEPAPVETLTTETEAEAVSEPVEVAPPVPVFMPALEAGTRGTDPTFALPELPSLGDFSALPFSVPRFSALASSAPPDLPQIPATPVTPATNTVARNTRGPARQGEFDLGRFFPRAARIDGLEGETTIELELDARGTVLQVTVLASSPPQVFDQAAEKAVRAMRFSPAERDGQPVGSKHRLILDWKLKR